jgi:Ca-activated chloride channel homolog
MTHEELKILISSYSDGEVTASEKNIVEEHLKTCNECQKDLAAYRKLSSSLKQWPDERLSPDVEMKIARQGATKERIMEKREVAVQWSSIAAVMAVVTFSAWGVHFYSQQQLSARVSDASFYLSQKNESYSLSKAVANKPSEEKGFVTARLKSSTDDIGDQFTAGSTNYKAVQKVSAAAAPQAEGAGKAMGGLVAAKEQLASTQQYEPYYLKTNYRASRQDTQFADGNKRAAGGYHESSYDMAAVSAPAPMQGFRGHIEADSVMVMEESRIAPQYYPMPAPPVDMETYDRLNETGFLAPAHNPLSTFSIDVDTASYSNVRRFLNQGQLPPQDAVRVEELVNYFSYDYPEPMWGQPFSITTEVAPCPWNPSHQLALIGLQGKRLNSMTMPASNLVFLIDVSGSMSDHNKLPLLQEAFRMMTHELEAKDKVSIVVYAGAAGLVLDATPGNYKERILSAIDQLRAGGSTAGGAGIRLAYQVARNNMIANGNNRVILATDGDFNVGVSSDDELVRMIEDYRDQGIFLTVLGFGEGNLKDSKMEKIADKGNGNYFYIDTQNEARKVLVHELGSTLFAIAKDVKIQVEFNPATVQAYRLIGYENRMLAKEDFNNDAIDAGELGAGHTVTALYEIIPAGSHPYADNRVDALKYQKTPKAPPVVWGSSSDLMTVKLRYKDPKGTTSKLIKKTVNKSEIRAYTESDNFKFASAAAEFGLLLRNSPYRASASFDHVLNQARSAKTDEFGYRAEFMDLVERARSLSPYIAPLPIGIEEPYYPAYDAPSQGKSQK